MTPKLKMQKNLKNIEIKKCTIKKIIEVESYGDQYDSITKNALKT